MNTVNFYKSGIKTTSVDDNFLRSGSVEKSIGLIGESLDIDTFTFYAYSEYELHPVLLLADSTGKALTTSDGKYILVKGKSDTDPTQSAYIGQMIMLTYTDSANNTINLGQFFVEDIEMVGKALYKFTCQTVYGVMATLTHEGGLYQNDTTAKSQISRIFLYAGWVMGEDIPIAWDSGVDDTIKLVGWLPYSTMKENLMRILFSLGYIIVWDGTQFLVTTPARKNATIQDSALQIGGTLTRVDRASEVRLTEHTFFKSPTDLEVTLFDNTNDTKPADDTVVIFENPCHDFSTTGTLVVENYANVGYGINYVNVTGQGTLTGYQYSHSQRELTAFTSATSGRTLTVSDETLVNPLNSKNVLQRLVNLQESPQEADIDFFPVVTDAIKLGDNATFTDTFGAKRQGVVENIKFDLSGNLKYKAKLALGFTPGPYGQSIQNYRLFHGANVSGTWTVPDDVDEVSVILGQAGSGGNGGYDGGDGADGTTGYRDQATYGNGGNPGAGGNGGEGGSAGKVNTVLLSVTAGDTISFTLGAKGVGGARSHGSGGTGGHATITYNGTTYTSNNGVIPPNGYYNPLSGAVYSVSGATGNAGYAGGTVHWDAETIAQGYGAGENGESEYNNNNPSSASYFYRYGLGGGGGGGTYITPYSAASDGAWGYIDYDSDDGWWSYGGNAGDGADAANKTGEGSYGSGGEGGDGGGGGGGGGGCRLRYYDEGDSVNGRGGDGGLGGTGQDGGQSYIIFYY